jgi:hypothetical protein
MVEYRTDIDEVKVLGFFETIKSTFFIKFLLIASHLAPDGKTFAVGSFDAGLMGDVADILLGCQTQQAIRAHSATLVPNLNDDLGNGALIGGWSVFELVIKDRTKRDYALHPDKLNADYHRHIFALSSCEKKDLELFYYIRTAFVHYNGTYFKAKAISHTFAGRLFESSGHEGEAIECTVEVAWKIILRIEELTLKAWSHSARSSPIAP